MKNFIATLLVTLFMFNVSIAQKLKEIEGNPEGDVSEFAFNQPIGLFEGVLFTANTIKGDLYLKGFQAESMEPLFNNRVGFSKENTDMVELLDIVLTANGIVLFGYKVDDDFSKIVFYAQEINQSGEIERAPRAILSSAYSKKVSNQKISVTTSQDLSKVALSFFRKNAKEKDYLVDVVVYDALEKSIQKADMKVVQQSGAATLTDFEFNVFVRNRGHFITAFEENIYGLNEENEHSIQALGFDPEGTLVNELDFGLDGVELYRPRFFESKGEEGFKVIGFFTSSLDKEKSMHGFMGVASIRFNQEDYQHVMEEISPFSERLLDNKLNVNYEKQGGLSRRYQIDNEGPLTDGQNYLTCTYVTEKDNKDYSILSSGDILMVSFGRDQERNFETVIEKPVSTVYVRSSNMSEKYISYPEWSLKSYSYYTQSDSRNLFVLYKEVNKDHATKGDNTVIFSTQLSARSMENGEREIGIIKEFYQEDQFLYYLKVYNYFNSDRFKER